MTTTNLSEKPRYFSSIDGLRLLASVNVVLFHFVGIGGLYDMGGKPGWLFQILKGPAFHASLFFVLGGFIFTTKFAPKIDNFSNWDFLKKRFKELYPLHFAMTLTMAALYIIRRIETDTLGAIDIPKLLHSLFMHLSFLWPFCPQGSLTLNTPSWALAAMFLCYVLFGPMLKAVLKLKTRGSVMIWMLLSIIVLAEWGAIYVMTGSPADKYQLFHGFAPVRLFEFVLGMLLAQFFFLRNENKHTARFVAIRSDVVMILMCALIWLCISPYSRSKESSALIKWFSYHVFLTPIYMVMIYTMAVEKGLFAKFFAISFIRKLGRTSFYPYLIHIPLMSTVTFICEQYFGYKKFLHDPVNIIVFMVVLYGGGYVYVYAIRNRMREKSKLKVLKSPEKEISLL